MLCYLEQPQIGVPSKLEFLPQGSILGLFLFSAYINDIVKMSYLLSGSLRTTQACIQLFITKTRLFKCTENFTTQKSENFQMKNSDIFHISAQYIDYGYSLEPPRGGSNECPQSMFLSRNKKNNVYPCKPKFYYIKVGFKGVKII